VKRRGAAYDGFLKSTNCKMNDMDSVTGITVIAINMAQGGSGCNI
jgi:hypothetical protein